MERKVEPVVCSCDQRKVIESVSNRKKMLTEEFRVHVISV